MKKILFLLSILPLVLFPQSAYLYFQHPQQTQKYAVGIITDAQFVIQPYGSYTRNDLTLTFSSKGMPIFSNDDSLEIRLQFSMTAGSNFTDMFLWIGDSAVRALLADRAKAKATYENIVKRRQDPALLERTYENNYKLSIYPMRADSSRKIMLSYFTPGALNDSNLTVVLPHWILRSSNVVQFSTTIIVRTDSVWSNPVLQTETETPFSSVVDPVYGQVYKTQIIPSALLNAKSMSVQWMNSSKTQPYLVERHRSDSAGVFQISIQPGKLFGITMIGRNFLFLVNYDSMSGSSAYSRSQIITDLKNVIKTQLMPQDSFNVIFAGKNGQLKLRNSWISVHPDTVNALLNNISIRPDLMDGFNITKLFFAAAEMMKGSSGNIILISSSEEYVYTPYAASAFADSLVKVLPPKTQIHSIDNNQWYHYYYIGNKYYYGNQYLYEYLSNKTLGSTISRSIYPGSYDNNSTSLNQIIAAIRGKIKYLDISVSLQSGITYMKQTLGYPLTSVAANSTVRQAGLFQGNFPMNVELTGMFDGNILYKKVTIQESEAVKTDSSLYSVWASYLINNLRVTSPSQELKQQISDISMRYRVLSEYTAFLALEPGQKLCDTCLTSNNGGPVVTGTTGKTAAPDVYDVMQAYPNPFNPSTTIKIRLPEGMDAAHTSLAIYNSLGQQVRRFETSRLTQKEYVSMTWDARNDNGMNVATGMYIAVLQTPKGKYSLKLMLIK